MKIAVTGAKGFVGEYLTKQLESAGHKILPISRDLIATGTDTRVFTGCDAIIHLASRTHQKIGNTAASYENYHRDNVVFTETLAGLANASKVKRFIYLSSIKAMTEQTQVPAKYSDEPKPEDHYGISKLAAEKVLQTTLTNTNTEWVIIRPPLIWGEHVKGNLQQVKRFIERGIPLPVTGINNKRDLISLDNLCDFIQLTLTHPNATDKTFLVSDGRPRNTAEIFGLMERFTSRKAKFLPAPPLILSWLAHFPTCKPAISRLTGNLELDIEYTKETLGWTPKHTY